MSGPRVVVGWRERDRLQAEREKSAQRGFAGLEFTGKYRVISVPTLDGGMRKVRQRVYASKALTPAAMAERARARREYKTRWAREHPESGRRWACKNRDRVRATARASYNRHLEERRAILRLRAKQRRDAIKAEGGETLAFYRQCCRKRCRKYRERLKSRRAGGPSTRARSGKHNHRKNSAR